MGEGKNLFDRRPSNGFSHVIVSYWSYTGALTRATDLLATFEAMPADVVSAIDPTYVSFAGEPDASLLIEDSAGGSCSAVLAVDSGKPYFVQWWGRGMLVDEEVEDRLGFHRRIWPTHAVSRRGMSEDEAISRVRLYLVGAGVDVSAIDFAARRVESGWTVSSNGDGGRIPAVLIGDDGVIQAVSDRET
ncbi:hypothetical protein JGU71_06875 [Antrihabitans sp. YC3-6]|uniref:Uncharacterized protein n=1 Tax=Antrihabitans stalagmiti TaxID=2799499 RepID=A0A934NNW7_9NOCA|nr:hypothetical protein [Antrihabitans stalagmiti]MBJ8338602.1 hypothetical protein [Antrihabitans stalagmiti]